MKGSDAFKNTIKGYLDNRAANDELFAPMYAKEGKNIDDCCTYIMNTVKKFADENKTNGVGFTDPEIFGMAIHYYQEDNIDIGSPINCKVVVNNEVVLTEEEKQQARKAAIDKEIERQRELLHSKKPAAKKEPAVTEQASLF